MSQPRTAPASPRPADVVNEALDVGNGLTVLLLPLMTITLPGVLLLVVLPVLLVLAMLALPLIVGGALAAPPYLLVRGVRRLRAR
jgi:hypothetical protein